MNGWRGLACYSTETHSVPLHSWYQSRTILNPDLSLIPGYQDSNPDFFLSILIL
jgi:hypothetical protein